MGICAVAYVVSFVTKAAEGGKTEKICLKKVFDICQC